MTTSVLLSLLCTYVCMCGILNLLKLSKDGHTQIIVKGGIL